MIQNSEMSTYSHLFKPNGDINIYYHAILGKPRRTSKERHRLTQAALHGAVSLGIHRAGGLVPLKYKICILYHYY
jgi:hypothetical protein